MTSDRRLVLLDRIIPFLAAVVGLIALAAAVVVHGTVTGQNAALQAEVTRLQQQVSLLTQQSRSMEAIFDQPAGSVPDEALAALQQRIERLEAAAPPSSSSAPSAVSATGPADPSLPTSDCIPPGTRFMVVAGDGIPICNTALTITAASISEDLVTLDSGVAIAKGTPAPLPGGGCTASLVTSDAAGFAELRVDCR